MAIELDKQYKTRGGRDVRIYAVDGGGGYPVHGSYNIGAGWQTAAWTTEGFFANVHELDLVAVKPRIQRTYWVNIYPKKDVENFWDNERMAKEAATLGSALARVKIDIDVEEGHGLE
jgi:hypothetical protein